MVCFWLFFGLFPNKNRKLDGHSVVVRLARKKKKKEEEEKQLGISPPVSRSLCSSETEIGEATRRDFSLFSSKWEINLPKLPKTAQSKKKTTESFLQTFSFLHKQPGRFFPLDRSLLVSFQKKKKKNRQEMCPTIRFGPYWVANFSLWMEIHRPFCAPDWVLLNLLECLEAVPKHEMELKQINPWGDLYGFFFFFVLEGRVG